MKSNNFNYSLLAIGVAAVMGLSTVANAAPSLTPTPTESGNAGTNSKTITNVATASYSVGGLTQTPVSSNPVTVSINEVISFSLTANNVDAVQNDEKNVGSTVVPEGFVTFLHTVKNTGNLDDTYTYNLTDLSGGKYNLAGSNATIIIKNENGVQQSSSTVNGVTTGSISLPAGYSAEINISAKSKGNQGGSTQSLQLSVQSAKIAAISTPANGAKSTVTNTDESSTILPIFSIAKTITSGTFDVTNSNAEVTYQVVVKNVDVTNGYSADATNVKIEDFLPTGLIMSAPLASTNIVATGGATISVGTISTPTTNKGFSFTATSIPKGGTVTITFKAKKAQGEALAQNALNHITVTDDLDDNANTSNTLIDSTDTTKQANINFYPTGDDQNITDGSAVADGTNGNDSTQPLNSTQRVLTLANPQVIQIPTVTNGTTQANHSVSVTNGGRDTESNLTFTLAKSNTADTVNVSNVQIGGTGTVLTPNTAGVYTIPGTLAPTTSINITYAVTSTNAKVGQDEKTTVTLVPSATPGNIPTVAPITDQTLIRGIKLDKKQVLDVKCNGSYTGTFDIKSLTASAGECVVYNIEAINTFDSNVLGFRDITGIVISDDLIKNGISTNADYSPGTVNNKNTSGTATTGIVAAPTTTNNLVVSNNVGTLSPQAKANLQFAVKIKQN